ncbi:MAG TPA: serpin family protein [Polyangiaceae bacterium]
MEGAPNSQTPIDVQRDPAASIPSSALSLAVTANNAFAVDLYSRVLGSAPDGNLLTSPLSASLALTMAYAGAAGDTATQMATALHVPAGSGATIFDGQNALDQALGSRAQTALTADQRSATGGGASAPSSDDYQLDLVNSIWAEQTLPLQTPFRDVLGKSYGAGVFLEDFVGQPDPSRVAINAWVSARTSDEINDLLPPGSIDSSTRVVLVNAIHLKLPWALPFSATSTMAGAFTRSDGTAVMAPFMNETGDFSYVDDGQAQIIALPLAGRDLDVLVALPHAGVDLATYEGTLASAASQALAVPAAMGHVALSLPKVDFTSPSTSLAGALTAMGMVDAFQPATADFSGISSGTKLYIADALQKTMIAMAEPGVEAAAATAVVFGATGAPANPPLVTMTVNRPFVISIVDATTQAILFLGHVKDPTQTAIP